MDWFISNQSENDSKDDNSGSSIPLISNENLSETPHFLARKCAVSNKKSCDRMRLSFMTGFGRFQMKLDEFNQRIRSQEDYLHARSRS